MTLTVYHWEELEPRPHRKTGFQEWTGQSIKSMVGRRLQLCGPPAGKFPALQFLMSPAANCDLCRRFAKANCDTAANWMQLCSHYVEGCLFADWKCRTSIRFLQGEYFCCCCCCWNWTQMSSREQHVGGFSSYTWTVTYKKTLIKMKCLNLCRHMIWFPCQTLIKPP